jgi:hypothetical protein
MHHHSLAAFAPLPSVDLVKFRMIRGSREGLWRKRRLTSAWGWLAYLQ